MLQMIASGIARRMVCCAAPLKHLSMSCDALTALPNFSDFRDDQVQAPRSFLGNA